MTLADRVLERGAGQRRAIAKAITLLESTRADHRAQADELLTALLPHTGRSFRLGISGVPGVGKSTFIEALGLFLIGKGHRVAVLTIDPSSTVSGGSILGDKTRMEKLSVHEQAYIRPSPSSGTLGGVAEKTREAMLVCEAAGYDIVIVETVGVGQSETAVAGMTDMFVLMQLPNAGDDLQAIKKRRDGAGRPGRHQQGRPRCGCRDARAGADHQRAAPVRAAWRSPQPPGARRQRELASAGHPAQRAAGRRAWTGSGTRSSSSGAADAQRPARRAPPAPGARVDVGAHRRRPEAGLPAGPAGAAPAAGRLETGGAGQAGLIDGRAATARSASSP